MKPQDFRKIRTLKELELAKYKLQLKLEYSEKRLGDKASDIKSKATLDHLGMIALQKGTSALSNISSSVMANNNGTSAMASSSEEKGGWMSYLPFLSGLITGIISLFFGKKDKV